MDKKTRRLQLMRITRNLIRAQALKRRARMQYLLALADFCLMTEQLERHHKLSDWAKSERLADEALSNGADVWAKAACNLRRSIARG